MALLLVAGLIVALDRISKISIQYFLSPGDSIQIIKGILYFTYVRNPGALFGIFPDKAFLFIPMSAAVIVAILFYYYQFQPGKIVTLGLSLALGGALGNLIDRLAFGQVIDFIDFRVWPVFNIADSAISVGLVIMALGMLKEVKKDKRSI